MPRRQGNPLFGIFLLFLPFIIMIISKKKVIHNHTHNHPLHKQPENNDTLQKHFNDTLHKQEQQKQNNDTLQVQEQKQKQEPDQEQQYNDTLHKQHNITKKNKYKINPDFMKMGEWNKIIQEPEREPALCYDYFVIPERKKSHLYALLQ